MWAELVLPDYLALIAFLTGLWRYKLLRPFPMKGFVFLLAFIIIVEWGAAAGYYLINKNNSWVFNILTTVECCFYFLLFSRMLKKQKVKKLAWFSALLFPFAVVANCAFFQGFNNLHTNTLIIGSLLIIVFTCSYFYELLQTPNEMKVFSVPLFWISTGLLFYYAGDFVDTAIFSHLVYIKDKTFIRIFHKIEFYLNTFLYCCFIIAFLCQRRTINTYT